MASIMGFIYPGAEGSVTCSIKFDILCYKSLSLPNLILMIMSTSAFRVISYMISKLESFTASVHTHIHVIIYLKFGKIFYSMVDHNMIC